MIKLVFFGTPDYVVPVLNSLHRAFKSRAGESPIVAVVTQPPRPTGRKQKLSYSPVDTWAHKRKVPIFFDSKDLIKRNVKADFGILASYGVIITSEVIKHFPNGILNIHPSLLPKWRGASPVQATLVAGDKDAGSTIIKIDELMDHGPIVSQYRQSIKSDDTTETLRTRLFARSGDVLTALIEPFLKGKINLREQEHDKATYTKLIKKDHAFIPPENLNATLQGRTLKGRWEIGFLKDFSLSPTPQVLERFIRAMIPWPMAWSKIRLRKQDLRIKILKAHVERRNTKDKRNTNNSKTSRASHITYLVLDEVQLEGKLPVSWEQFNDAYPEARFS